MLGRPNLEWEMKSHRTIAAGTALAMLMTAPFYTGASSAAPLNSGAPAIPQSQNPNPPVVLAQASIEELRRRLEQEELTEEERQAIEQQIEALESAAAAEEEAEEPAAVEEEPAEPAEEPAPAEEAPAAEEAAPAEEEAPAEEPAPEETAPEQPMTEEEPPAEEPAVEEPTQQETEPAEEAPAAEEAAPAEEAAEEPVVEEETPAEEPADADEQPATEAPAAEEEAPAEEGEAEEAPVEEQPAEEAAPEDATDEQAPAEQPAEQAAPSGEEPAAEEAPAEEQPAAEEPAAEELAPEEEGAADEEAAETEETGEAAPVLDSQKEAEASGEAEAEADADASADAEAEQETGAEAEQEAEAEQAPPPESDEAAQAEAVPEPAEIESAAADEGTRVEESQADARIQRRSDAEIIGEIAGRVIMSLAGRQVIESSDRDRLRYRAEDVYYEELPRGRIREVIVRRNGARIITIRDRYGDIIRRSRITPDGREYILVYAGDRDRDDDGRFDRWRDPGRDLPPLRLRIPVRDYILDADRVDDPDRYYEFLDQPPVERVRRLYSIDEVRYSARVRDAMRRVDLDNITFDFGSAAIGESQIPKLEGLAHAMSRMIDENPAETFLIEGHTDAVGTEPANLALSDERADAVARALTRVFEIPPENLVTQGYGEAYLKVNTQEPNRTNRRVAVRRITPLVAPVASR